MSFARRVLLTALIIQILGFGREILFAIGLERWFETIVTLSDPTIVAATAISVIAIALLVPVWRGNRWATLATVPLMIVLLLAVVPAVAPLFGSPSSGNFTVWITITTILTAAAAGIPFAILATLESFGRRAPRQAMLNGGGFSGSSLVVATVIGSLLGMGILGVAVAASPTTGSGPIMDTAPDEMVTVTLKDLRFVPDHLSLRAGKTTAVFLTNEDGFDHSFDIDSLDLHVPVPAGHTVVAMVHPEPRQELAVYCGIPGHAESGMVATIVGS